MSVSGRVFLGSSAALALGPARVPAGPAGRMKIGVTDWNLRQTGKFAAVGLAKSLGFDGVEVSLGRKPAHEKLPLADSEIQAQYLSEAAKQGIQIAGTCLDILHVNYLKNDKLGQKWVADGIPITKKLNAHVMLLPFFGKGALQLGARNGGMAFGIAGEANLVHAAVRENGVTQQGGRVRIGAARLRFVAADQQDFRYARLPHRPLEEHSRRRARGDAARREMRHRLESRLASRHRGILEHVLGFFPATDALEAASDAGQRFRPPGRSLAPAGESAEAPAEEPTAEDTASEEAASEESSSGGEPWVLDAATDRPADVVRSAGGQAQLMAKDGPYAQLKMPSGEVRLVPRDCKATVGQVGNVEHETITLGNAGRSRHLGIRPTVRGGAMNPVDHPLGGGRGKSKGNNQPRSTWNQRAGRSDHSSAASPSAGGRKTPYGSPGARSSRVRRITSPPT